MAMSAAPDYTPLFYWVRQREEIRRRKETGLGPESWTPDTILSTYRFCNVRREDDRVTVWVRDHIRKPYADYPNLWLMLCIARQVNWPMTLWQLINDGAWPSYPDFKPSDITLVLNKRKMMGEKVYTGAY